MYHRLSKVFFYIFCLGIMTQCQWFKKSSEPKDDDPIIHKNEAPEEIKIPKQIWESIKNISPQNTPVLEYNFSEIEIHLLEKNQNVLDKPNIKIRFSKGGGELDLAPYLGSHPGTFFLKYKFLEDIESAEQQIYFVSNTQQFDIKNEKLGLGCDKFIQINKKGIDLLLHKGLKLNTTQDRYFPIIGGHWIFVAKTAKQVHLAQITITNTRLKSFSCEQNL